MGYDEFGSFNWLDLIAPTERLDTSIVRRTMNNGSNFKEVRRTGRYEFGMPQSLSQIIVHLVFSTKDRRPMLKEATRERLYPYMAQVVRDRDSECYRIGGVEDHVHLAIRLSRTEAVSKLVSEVKTATSKWLKGTSPSMSDFAWQEGYGAFSVSSKDLNALIQYIDEQEEHHVKLSFQDEFRKFLTQYGIDYDERYVWG